jgi:hypothetical protein
MTLAAAYVVLLGVRHGWIATDKNFKEENSL